MVQLFYFRSHLKCAAKWYDGKIPLMGDKRPEIWPFSTHELCEFKFLNLSLGPGCLVFKRKSMSKGRRHSRCLPNLRFRKIIIGKPRAWRSLHTIHSWKAQGKHLAQKVRLGWLLSQAEDSLTSCHHYSTHTCIRTGSMQKHNRCKCRGQCSVTQMTTDLPNTGFSCLGMYLSRSLISVWPSLTIM